MVNRMKTWRPNDNPDNIDPSMDPNFLEISQSLESRVTREKKRKRQKLKHTNLMILKLKLNIALPYLHHQYR